MLHILDILFDLLHILLMIFIASGWLFPELRRIHLFVVILTGGSWIFYGNESFNCILTEWHFDILRKMGKIDLPDTYTQYALKRFTGLAIHKTTALLITRLCWVFILILSITRLRLNSLSRNREKVEANCDYQINNISK